MFEHVNRHVCAILWNCFLTKPKSYLLCFYHLTAVCLKKADSESAAQFIVNCPIGCLSETSKLWGTDVYTSDSYMCAAAIHSGIITSESRTLIVWNQLRSNGHNKTDICNRITQKLEKFISIQVRGWEPATRGPNAARVTIWYGPHQNFLYLS